jgi:hypothetical protein
MSSFRVGATHLTAKLVGSLPDFNTGSLSVSLLGGRWYETSYIIFMWPIYHFRDTKVIQIILLITPGLKPRLLLSDFILFIGVNRIFLYIPSFRPQLLVGIWTVLKNCDLFEFDQSLS